MEKCENVFSQPHLVLISQFSYLISFTIIVAARRHLKLITHHSSPITHHSLNCELNADYGIVRNSDTMTFEK